MEDEESLILKIADSVNDVDDFKSIAKSLNENQIAETLHRFGLILYKNNYLHHAEFCLLFALQDLKGRTENKPLELSCRYFLAEISASDFGFRDSRLTIIRYEDALNYQLRSTTEG